ncbi:lipopolysaccharide kinase [Pseudomethylobacillus aquaticus]|uniref:Lipopolysaccharide kinase n=1 Tax=Pseudomethylobacillus aquaticus TaxID=2676064 RepID=A0A3N0UYF0_9PROT|nr:lipopolysaccharide kinase InaA family protein [Pseudomethylobacillus aquaticus]ROH85579.1 lipopolysaccharide kinase [Pseudomethylobacillus aquaticus]
MQNTEFIADDYRALLSSNALDRFDLAWARNVAWVEPPNLDRGGFSGVGRLGLQAAGGSTVHVYLKRQENHVRKSLAHPWRGEPTLLREFSIIQHLQRHGVPTLEPILFCTQSRSGQQRAVMVTLSLEGYVPMDVFTQSADFLGMSLTQKRAFIAAAANIIKEMHAAGVQHRALYAKHVFVKLQSGQFKLALIDLEKARKSWLPLASTYFDLTTLNYRTAVWSRTSRLYFLKQYFAVARLTGWQKLIGRLIAARSIKKQKVLV